MSEVYLDGEYVDFQGPVPVSAEEVWELLEQHLGGQVRTIRDATVDGSSWSPNDSGQGTPYERMEIFSVSLSERFAELARAWLAERSALLGEMEALGRSSLSMAWADTQARTFTFFENFGGSAQGLALLLEYLGKRGFASAASLQEPYQASLAALECLANATQAGDCVGVSETLAFDLSPAWERTLAAVEHSVLGELDAEGAGAS